MSEPLKHNCVDVTVTEHAESSTVEIHAEIPSEILAKHRSRTLKRLSETIKIDGFRAGAVPEHMLLREVGEESLVAQVADDALSEELPVLLASLGHMPIVQPKVTIHKMGVAGSALGFKAVLEVLPTLSLPDYVAIASKHLTVPEIMVSPEEFAETMLHMRRQKARIDAMETGAEPQAAVEAMQALPDDALPVLDDAFAVSLNFTDLTAFETQVRENIAHEKLHADEEKRRIAMLEELVAAVDISMPPSLLAHEIEKMDAQFAGDLENNGTTVEAYLEHIKKTKEELHAEWLPSATKRAKTMLILAEIARIENISSDEAKVQSYTEHTLKEYKGASRTNIEAYYRQQFRQEAVLAFLMPPIHDHSHDTDESGH
jgi:FKBP-type peptidyl-prolyl cis-trans isomerase (trigger factor)